MSSAELLWLYQELGSSITIGPDSHTSAHLHAYIEETRQLLRNRDFKSFCTYQRIQPFHTL